MDAEGFSEAERELKEQLNDDFPVGPLIRKCCTLDQGNAVITFLDKTLCSTVALLTACGRGKLAALRSGNCWSFSCGEHLDYGVVKSANPEFKKATVRINILQATQTNNLVMDSEGFSEPERELKNLKEQLHNAFPVGPLIRKCCTLDQGNAIITFLDAILDKTLCSTVALLTACGRGKSAALGLAIAEAIAAGYSNIFENLKTLV